MDKKELRKIMAANRGRKCVYFIRYGGFYLSVISGKCIGFRHNREKNRLNT